MAIKVEVDEKTCKTKEYPYIGRSRENGRIVLFIRSNRGTSLNSVGNYDQGIFDAWDEDDYDKITGTITITCD